MTITELAPQISSMDILHPGVYQRAGTKKTFASTLSKEQAAVRALDFNRVARIERDCFSFEADDVLLLAQPSSHPDKNEMVAGMVPLAGRAHESIMIMAGDLNRSDGEHIITHFVQDLEESTQEAYWDLVLGSLYTIGATCGEGEVAAVTMNAYSAFSNELHRLPQTIGVPHAFVSRHRRQEVIPFAGIGEMRGKYREVDEAQGGTFSRERRFLRNFPHKDKVVDAINGALGEDNQDIAAYYRSRRPPFGPEVLIAQNEPMTGAQMAQIMRKQHEVYKGQVVPLFESEMTDDQVKELHPQPSCQYLITAGRLPDGSDRPLLRIAVRPSFWAPTGPLETAGQMTNPNDNNGEPDFATKVEIGMATFAKMLDQGHVSQNTLAQLHIRPAA